MAETPLPGSGTGEDELNPNYNDYNYEAGNLEIYENPEFRLAEHYSQDAFTDSIVEFRGVQIVSLDELPSGARFIPLGDLPSTHMAGFIINGLDHFLILLLSLIIATRCMRLGLASTSLHTCFCTLAYLCFIAEGMMVIYSGNIWSLDFDSDTRHITHFILLFIGGILGLYGTIHKFCNKPKHFETRHSRFGLVASLFLVLNIIVGAITKMSETETSVSPMVYKLIHNGLGFVCFICAMISLILGFDTGFFHREFQCVNVFKIFAVFIMVFTLIGPFQNLIWKIYEVYSGKSSEETSN